MRIYKQKWGFPLSPLNANSYEAAYKERILKGLQKLEREAQTAQTNLTTFKRENKAALGIRH